MKRIGNLYSRIVSIGNLHKASFKAQKGKSKKKEIRDWNYNLEENIWKLHKDLVIKLIKFLNILFLLYMSQRKERSPNFHSEIE